MTCKVINFKKKAPISEVTKLRYTNLMCHKIFVEERIASLEQIASSNDILKHTQHKGFPVEGYLRNLLLSFINEDNEQNWCLIKNEKIACKLSANEVWEKYKKELDKELPLSASAFLFALKFNFNKELKGYKERLNETLKQLSFIKEKYQDIDNQIDLESV